MLHVVLFALFLVISEQLKRLNEFQYVRYKRFFLQISKNIFDLFAFSLFLHSQ